MKSLEHIIREIREGKCCCEKKKDSLEHSIRKVVRKESSYAAKDSKPVDEDVGGLAGSGTGGEPTFESAKKKVRKEDSEDIKLPGNEDKMDEAIGTIGTDKYQGTEFKSIRTATPHIKPPGPEHGHSQAPENASRLRSIAKEKQGINRVSESILGPLSKLAKPIAKKAEPLVKDVEDMIKMHTAPTSKGELVPYKKQELTVTKTAEPEAKAVTKAAEPETKAVTTTDVKTKTAAPEVKPVSPAEVKVSPKTPEPQTIDLKPVSPKTGDLPKAGPKAEAKPAPAGLKPISPSTSGKKMVIVPPIGGGLGKGSYDDQTAWADKWNQKPGTASHARKHKSFKHHVREETRKDIENMPRPDIKDRKDVQYVGRKKTNTTIARQAVIKNVIDESKEIIKDKKERREDSGKTKVFPTAVVNPDLNKIDSSPEVRS